MLFQYCYYYQYNFLRISLLKMSILSQFFEGRHNTESQKQKDNKNQEITQIFSTNYQKPKIKAQNKKNILKKPLKQQIQNEQNAIDNEDNNIQMESQQEENLITQTKKEKSKNIKKQKKQLDKQKQSGKKSQNFEKQHKNKQKIDEIAQQQSNEEKIEEQQKPQQKQNLQSTIFVGNIPLQSTHKTLKKYFEKYGKVLKVWFRSIPVQQSKIPKKGLHILKKYQQGADSMNAYVKFEKQQDSIKACKANGQLMDGKNIKVTRCNEHEIDYETTIFIGNLPRKVKDQELWDMFKDIGKIKSVRVIRNKENFEAIGVGYVRFETKTQMKNAILQKNGKELGGRPMRIKKAVPKERIQKKIKKVQQKKKIKKQIAKNDKTGKGKKPRHQNGRNGTNFNNFKHKPINKSTNNYASNNSYVKKDTNFKNDNAVNPINQSSEVIRSKYSFQGTKKTLQ